MRSLNLITALICALSAVPALAQNYVPQAQPMQAPMRTAPGSMIDSVGSGAIPSIPVTEQSTSNGVQFINGGISDEEVAELKAHAHEFNVQVLLSAKNGEYVSNVSFRILDGAGNPVISIADAGPYVYAKLAAGHYTLEANGPGGNKSEKITVGKGLVKKHYVFTE